MLKLLTVKLREAAAETEDHSQNVFRHGNAVDSFGIADHDRALQCFREYQRFHSGRQGVDPAERLRLTVDRPDVVESPGDQDVGSDDVLRGPGQVGRDDGCRRGHPGYESFLAVGDRIENKNFRCNCHDIPPAGKSILGDFRFS